MSKCWPGKVYVITYRTDQAKAERDVAEFGIRCDEVVLVSRFDQKADVIADRGITVYVDDQDEMLLHIPEGDERSAMYPWYAFGGASCVGGTGGPCL